ncbi:sensor histidine kinase N-terminal domain-containing protein [Candidatus Sumerlaeota bacterium]|nr:sensor histidine kinase N-terminal domain-containing protein [Candidatus Sumerlaeota bacterium]
MKPNTSLRKRLLVLFLAVDLILIFSFATGAYIYMVRRFNNTFNTAMRANAEALATLVSVEDDNHLELEFSDEVMSRFSRKNHPDLFAILARDGSLFEKSRHLPQLPKWASSSAETEWHDFLFRGERYRGIVLPALAAQEDGNRRGASAKITVIFATRTEDMDDELRHARNFLLIGAGVIIAISLLAVYWVVRRGLLPLKRLADETSLIDSESLDRRFDNGMIPRDLHPFTNSFNHLLSRLQAAFENERQFSADVAHELRTPVSVLKSGIQSALLSPPDAVKDRASLAELLDDVVRLETLCESLLISSRTDAPDEAQQLMSTEQVAHQLGRIVDSFSIRAAELNATIALNVETSDPHRVRTTAETVQRVIGNLIENALCHGGPTIVVSAGHQGDAFVISVADNGPGVPPGLLPRLFQRFSRGDKSRSRSTGGAGLGLAISRTLVERNGGTLTYANDGNAKFAWRIGGEFPPPTIKGTA